MTVSKPPAAEPKKSEAPFIPEGWTPFLASGACYLGVMAFPIPAAIVGAGLFARAYWLERNRPKDDDD